MSIFDISRPANGGVDEFWSETEQAIGEAVVAQGLAQYHSGGAEEGPLWGLVYVTATRVFFRHFPQESWISSLMSSGTGGSRDKSGNARARDITLQWTLSAYTDVEEEQQRTGFKAFVFGKPAGRLTLTANDEKNEPVVFTVEHNRSAVISALKQGLGR